MKLKITVKSQDNQTERDFEYVYACVRYASINIGKYIVIKIEYINNLLHSVNELVICIPTPRPSINRSVENPHKLSINRSVELSPNVTITPSYSNEASEASEASDISEASSSSGNRIDLNEDDEIFIECSRFVIIRNNDLVFDSDFYKSKEKDIKRENIKVASLAWEYYKTNNVRRIAVDLSSTLSTARKRVIIDYDEQKKKVNIISERFLER